MKNKKSITIKTNKMNHYRLLNYFDVYKDEEGSWSVNNQCVECEDLCLDENITDKEILTYLKKANYLTTDDLRRLTVKDLGELIEVYQKKDMIPLFGLMPIN